jgi:CheY-like chemotaxis protein
MRNSSEREIMGNTICFFLVDDDVDDQEIFDLALQGVGTSTKLEFANDGVEAISRIQNDTSFLPHCIFIDLNMPRMNGQQCLQELRKIERIRQVPIVMYSTTVNPQYLADALNHGATDFIEKPITIEALTESLSKIFQMLQNSFAAIDNLKR